jgi:hypothetical protein
MKLMLHYFRKFTPQIMKKKSEKRKKKGAAHTGQLQTFHISLLYILLFVAHSLQLGVQTYNQHTREQSMASGY